MLPCLAVVAAQVAPFVAGVVHNGHEVEIGAVFQLEAHADIFTLANGIRLVECYRAPLIGFEAAQIALGSTHNLAVFPYYGAVFKVVYRGDDIAGSEV